MSIALASWVLIGLGPTVLQGKQPAAKKLCNKQILTWKDITFGNITSNKMLHYHNRGYV